MKARITIDLYGQYNRIDPLLLAGLAEHGPDRSIRNVFFVDRELVKQIPLDGFADLGVNQVKWLRKKLSDAIGEAIPIELLQPGTSLQEFNQSIDKLIIKSLSDRIQLTSISIDLTSLHGEIMAQLYRRPDGASMSSMINWVWIELLNGIADYPRPSVPFSLGLEANVLTNIHRRREPYSYGAAWQGRVLCSVLFFRDFCVEVKGARELYELGIRAIHELRCSTDPISQNPPQSRQGFVCINPPLPRTTENLRILRALSDMRTRSADGSSTMAELKHEYGSGGGDYYVIDWEAIEQNKSFVMKLGPKTAPEIQRWAKSAVGKDILFQRNGDSASPEAAPGPDDWVERDLLDRIVRKNINTSNLQLPVVIGESIDTYHRTKAFLNENSSDLKKLVSWLPLELLQGIEKFPEPSTPFNVRVEANVAAKLSNNLEKFNDSGPAMGSFIAFRDVYEQIPGGRDFYVRGICALHELLCPKQMETSIESPREKVPKRVR